MLRVIRNHRRAAYDGSDYEDVSHTVVSIDPAVCPDDLLTAARSSWDLALEYGEANGYRNAQATVIAPTGTIGLLMDCDTTGVEPDFALVKFKKLAGGGYFKIVNQSVAPALTRLGYTPSQITEIVEYIVGTSSFDGAPHVNRETLLAKGLNDSDIDRLEKTLPATFELRFAFNSYALGEEAMGRLGFTPTSTWHRTSTCSVRSGSAPPRSRRPTTTSAVAKRSRVHRTCVTSISRCSTRPTRTGSTAPGSSTTTGTS
jgi:ribonucleoside-diphosphate reductase alpha chain